jgi:hypothetical protein
MEFSFFYVEESRPPLWSSGQSSWLHNGDVLCFLRGTNWIYICQVEESRPPLWSSGQSSWKQIQRFGFDSRRYEIFWEVVGLERSPLSLVRATEELLGRNSICFGLESQDYGLRDPSRWPSGIHLSAKVGTSVPRHARVSTSSITFRRWVVSVDEWNAASGVAVMVNYRNRKACCTSLVMREAE